MATPEAPHPGPDATVEPLTEPDAIAARYWEDVGATRHEEERRLTDEHVAAEKDAAWEEHDADDGDDHSTDEDSERIEAIDAHRARIDALSNLKKEEITLINKFGIPADAVVEAVRRGVPIQSLVEAKRDPSLMARLRAEGIFLGPLEEEIAERAGIPTEIVAEAARHGYGAEHLELATRNPAAAERLRRLGVDWEGAAPTPDRVPEPGREIPETEIRSVETLHGLEITPQYLRFARRHPHAADFLRSLGLDIGVEGSIPYDPVLDLMRNGRNRDQEIIDIARQIEIASEQSPVQSSGPISERLERPGRLRIPLPAGNAVPLERIPLLGPGLANRLLALRVSRRIITRREEAIAELQRLQSSGVRREAEQADMETLPAMIAELESHRHTDGRLNLGLPRYHTYLDYIRNLDASIKSERRDVGRIDRHKLRGPGRNSTRRDLAEKIYKSHHAVEALRDLRIDPDNLYSQTVHSNFKTAQKNFQDTLER